MKAWSLVFVLTFLLGLSFIQLSKQLPIIPISTILPKSSAKGYQHRPESVEANTLRSSILGVRLCMKTDLHCKLAIVK